MGLRGGRLEYRAAAEKRPMPTSAPPHLGLGRALYRCTLRCSDLHSHTLVSESRTHLHRTCEFPGGQCLVATQHYDEAASAYAGYISSRPGCLDSYVSGLRGDALTEAGDYAGALDAYTSAQTAPIWMTRRRYRSRSPRVTRPRRHGHGHRPVRQRSPAAQRTNTSGTDGLPCWAGLPGLPAHRAGP